MQYSLKIAPFAATAGRTVQCEAIYQRFARLRPLYSPQPLTFLAVLLSSLQNSVGHDSLHLSNSLKIPLSLISQHTPAISSPSLLLPNLLTHIYQTVD